MRVATKAAIAFVTASTSAAARPPSEMRYAASHAFQSRSRMNAGAMSCSAIRAVSPVMLAAPSTPPPDESATKPSRHGKIRRRLEFAARM